MLNIELDLLMDIDLDLDQDLDLDLDQDQDQDQDLDQDLDLDQGADLELDNSKTQLDNSPDRCGFLLSELYPPNGCCGAVKLLYFVWSASKIDI